MKRGIALFYASLLSVFCIIYGFQKQRQEKVLKPLEYEVTVTLAVVEVFVTDKEGNFVDDLTKDDFEIYEDGKRVEIQYFSVVKPEKGIPKEKVFVEIVEKERPQPPQKMKLVMLFDNLNTHTFYLLNQWPQIVEMFKALSGKVEETMIIELNRISGMRIIQPFTTDQNLLANKISEFKVDFWKGFEEHYLRSQLETLEKEARLSLEDRILGNPEYLMYALREEDEYFKKLRLGDSFSAFLAAVNYIRRFEGVKSILMVSDGFHLAEKGKGFVRIFDPFRLFGGKRFFEQREAFEKFLELINEEKLIFYAVSPRGLRGYFSATAPEMWPGDMFRDEKGLWEKELYSLDEIANKTGGMYLGGQKKYENFVKELGRDLTHFYDISYTPPRETSEKGFHTIEVKVKRPGLTLRHKKGYSDFTEEELEKRVLASAFLSPSFYRDIMFSCKADYIALRGGDPQFWIRMNIPLNQFRNIEDESTPEKLGLMFGINQWKKDRVHFGETELRVKAPVDEGYDTLYYAFVASGLKLSPGEYETRVILKKAMSQIGGWESILEIPDIKKALPSTLVNSILGLLIEDTAEGKIPFSISKKDCTLNLSRYQFYPFVENACGKVSDAGLYLQIYNPKKNQDFSLQFTLLKDEETVFNVPFEKIESFFDKKLRILNEVYLLNFDEIPPGDYQFKIISPDKKIEKAIEIKIIS